MKNTNKRVIQAIIARLLLAVLLATPFPLSVLAGSQSDAVLLLLSDSNGNILDENSMGGFRFQVTGFDNNDFNYLYTEFQVRKDGQSFASVNADSLNPTIRLGEAVNYVSFTDPPSIYAVHYRIHYSVSGESTELTTDWKQARVYLNDGEHDFYFIAKRTEESLAVVNVETLEAIQVPFGTSLSDLGLPEEVEIELSDGSTRNVHVNWDNGTPTYDPSIDETYTFTGTLVLSDDVTNPLNLTAQLQIRLLPYTSDQDSENPVWPNSAALTVTDVTYSSVKLSWPSATDNIGVAGYRIYVNDTIKRTVTSSVYDHQLYNLAPNATYQFALTAYDAAGNESEVLSASTTTLPLVLTEVPKLADILVPEGTERTALPLPSTVQIGLSDNSTQTVDVVWDHGTPAYNKELPGEYVFTGTPAMPAGVTNPSGIKAQVTVIVTPSKGGDSGGGGTGDGEGYRPSRNANLSDLQVWDYGNILSLTPEFAANITEYKAETESDQVRITAETVSSKAKVTLDGKSLDKGVEVNLEPGDNTFSLIVEAENGKKKTYSLTIRRLGMDLTPGEPIDAPNIMFSDISGHWAEEDIYTAVQMGIVNGYPDGSFGPNQPVTRVQFVVMLSRLLGMAGDGDWTEDDLPVTNPPFSDKDSIPDWAKADVAALVSAGIISGYEDNTFRPGQTISRVEMAVLAARALGLSITENSTTDFSDDEGIPNWAKPYVQAIVEAGLMQGRGENNFVPSGNATRAESVVVMLRLLSNLTSPKELKGMNAF